MRKRRVNTKRCALPYVVQPRSVQAVPTATVSSHDLLTEAPGNGAGSGALVTLGGVWLVVRLSCMLTEVQRFPRSQFGSPFGPPAVTPAISTPGTQPYVCNPINTEGTTVITGTVKWFRDAKGFGFITRQP